jgi:hypothetical protein
MIWCIDIREINQLRNLLLNLKWREDTTQWSKEDRKLNGVLVRKCDLLFNIMWDILDNYNDDVPKHKLLFTLNGKLDSAIITLEFSLVNR